MDMLKILRKTADRTINRAMLVFWVVVSIAGMIFIPFYIHSAYVQVTTNTTDAYAYPILKKPESLEFNNLALSLDQYDVVAGNVTLTVRGYRYCRISCAGYRDKLIFSAIPNDPAKVMVLKSVSVNIPADTTQFVERIVLPIQGTLSEYPFDRYSFNLGMAVERIENGQTRILEPDRDEDNFSVTFDENLSGMRITQPVIFDPRVQSSARDANHYYLIAFRTTLKHPFYMQVFVGLLFLLFFCATMYTIFNTSFDKIMLNTGAIIFGLWATRNVVLGPIPAHVTFIDMALGILVIFVTLSIGIHASIYYLNNLKNSAQEEHTKRDEKTSESIP